MLYILHTPFSINYGSIWLQKNSVFLGSSFFFFRVKKGTVYRILTGLHDPDSKIACLFAAKPRSPLCPYKPVIFQKSYFLSEVPVGLIARWIRRTSAYIGTNRDKRIL
jgi:hypothetical protein